MPAGTLGPATACMRLAIATSGRFHVLDLARELYARGHSVQFLSHVPARRALRFGLPREIHHGLLGAVWPWVAWQRLAPHSLRRTFEKRLYAALNAAVISRLQPCDAFIFMSGVYVEAARAARQRHGAKLVTVRSSEHIQTVHALLTQSGSRDVPSKVTVERELAGYEIADMIDVPSEHVRQTFLAHPGYGTKAVCNPIGTDLSQFPLSARCRVAPPVRAIFAGQWCFGRVVTC